MVVEFKGNYVFTENPYQVGSLCDSNVVSSADMRTVRHSCEQASQVMSTTTMSSRVGTVDTRRASPWPFPHAGHC
jgi:hypothetical protein